MLLYKVLQSIYHLKPETSRKHELGATSLFLLWTAGWRGWISFFKPNRLILVNTCFRQTSDHFQTYTNVCKRDPRQIKTWLCPSPPSQTVLWCESALRNSNAIIGGRKISFYDIFGSERQQVLEKARPQWHPMLLLGDLKALPGQRRDNSSIQFWKWHMKTSKGKCAGGTFIRCMNHLNDSFDMKELKFMG